MRVTDARLVRLGDSCQFEARVTLESVQADPVPVCGIVSHWIT